MVVLLQLTTVENVLKVCFNSNMSDINSAYMVLRDAAKQRGLFEKMPGYYIAQTMSALGIISSGFLLLWLFSHIALQIGAIVILSIGMVQAALIGHDIAHHQVFRSQRLYNIFGTFYWNFILGVSFRYWNFKHNRHHAHPNHFGKDPDLGVPFIFSKTRSTHVTEFFNVITKYQKIYFFPILPLSFFSVVGLSARFLMRQKMTATILAEWTLYILHYVTYFWLLGSFLSFERIMILTLIHYMTTGMYLGMVFAPNHKGRPLFDENEITPYAYQQVVTSRNIRPHILTDFFYGGLNYQIEHHLFPTMARPNLRRARALVRTFCNEEKIPYQETSFLGSFRQIYQNFVTNPKTSDI